MARHRRVDITAPGDASRFLEIRLVSWDDPRQRHLWFGGPDLDRSMPRTKKLLEEWRLKAM